jgi:hypothetical protein
MPTLPDLLSKNLDTNGGDGVHQGAQPSALAVFMLSTKNRSQNWTTGADEAGVARMFGEL